MFTVVLAGIAVFTAVQLYNQRDVAVAPTAPTSIPRAQEAPADDEEEPATTACEPVSFSLTGPKCGDACTAATASTACPTDHTCDTTTNKCVLTSCTTAGATCSADKCTPTTNPSCGGTCTTNADCPTDHTCNTNKCVLSVCLEAGRTCNQANCALAPKCGDTCSNNSQCPTDHTCSGTKCVLTSCMTSGASCNTNKCALTTASSAPASSQPELPVAGTETPTIIALAIGVFAIIGALAFAL